MARNSPLEIEIWWAPIPKTDQAKFFDDDTPDASILFQGGWGSGKTMTLTAKMLKLSAINAPLTGLWTVPDYAHIHDTILPMMEDTDPDTGKPWFLHPAQFHYHETRHLFTWAGGGPIQFVSAERPKTIAGPNVAFAGTDEPGSISAMAWRNTCARVRHAGAKLRQKIAAGTPEGITYLLDYFGPDRTDKYKLYTMETRENVELLRHNPDYIEQAKTGLTEAEAMAYLGGRAINISGSVVYPEFDPEIHWSMGVQPADRKFPLVITCDFNVDPMMWVIGQKVAGPYGLEPHIVDMVAQYGSATIDSACSEVIKKYPSWPAGFEVYGDASGKARHVRSLKSNYDIIQERLRAVGPVKIKVPLANPPVQRRINSVNRIFKDATGRMRCWVRKTEPARSCSTRPLVMSLQQTIKATGTDDIMKRPGETVTHASDALGYWIVSEWPVERPVAFSASNFANINY